MLGEWFLHTKETIMKKLLSILALSTLTLTAQAGMPNVLMEFADEWTYNKKMDSTYFACSSDFEDIWVEGLSDQTAPGVMDIIVETNDKTYKFQSSILKKTEYVTITEYATFTKSKQNGLISGFIHSTPDLRHKEFFFNDCSD